MNPVTAVVVFIIIWWLTLFMVLPWGVRRTESPEEGHDQGAPAQPMLGRKLLITSGIAIVVFGVTYAIIEMSGLSLRDLSDRYRL
jgi:predicted secreted protein